MNKLHLRLRGNHLSISSSNFTLEVSVFNCFGREFQTRSAKDLKLLSPKVTLFRIGIFKMYFFEIEFSFFSKQSLVKVRQFLLKALKVFNATNLSRLTSIVHLLVFSKEFHNLKNNHLGETLMLFFVCFQFCLWIFQS